MSWIYVLYNYSYNLIMGIILSVLCFVYVGIGNLF